MKRSTNEIIQFNTFSDETWKKYFKENQEELQEDTNQNATTDEHMTVTKVSETITRAKDQTS